MKNLMVEMHHSIVTVKRYLWINLDLSFVDVTNVNILKKARIRYSDQCVKFFIMINLHGLITVKRD